MTRARDVASNGGLVLISSTTIGSAVSSVTLSNCFSSTYDIYEIILSNVTVSNRYLKIQLRTGSTTSTSTYLASEMYASLTTSAIANDQNFAYSGAGWMLAFNSTNGGTVKATIQNPYLTKYTSIDSMVTYEIEHGKIGGIHSSATSYDQLVLTPNSGTWTGGTISIYGYKK